MMNNSISAANSMAAASAVMLQGGQQFIEHVLNQAPTSRQEADKEPEVYNMTSGLFSCVCVAMYETMLSPQFFEQNMNDGEEEFFYDTVRMEDWKKSLTKAAQDYLNDTIIDVLRDYGLLNIEAVEIWSPKYYNYHQDELVMDVTMQQGWQRIMAAKVAQWKDCEAVKRYISKHWKSCSGYVNFMPESLDEVLTEDNKDRQLAAYLTLALVAEGIDLDYGNIMEDLYYRMDDFSGYDRVNVLAEYMDEDEAQKLIDLWNDDCRWNELYWNLRDKIGSPWRRDKDYESLDGKEDCGFSWQADSDGKRMLFWAVKNEHTVEDLYDMAA